jgi:predicted lipoprotein
MLGDDLAERLLGEIEAARVAYADGDVDLGRELSREVEATLATEVAAHLDVTIGFSDADGDSAG